MARKPKCSESIFNEKLLATFKGKKPSRELAVRLEKDLMEAFQNSPNALEYKARVKDLYSAFKQQVRTEQAFKLRNAAIRADLRARVLDPAFKERPVEAMMALIDHSILPAEKGSVSVLQSINDYNSRWKNMFVKELKEKNLWKIAQTSDLDEEVRKALYDMNNAETKYKVSDEAKAIAEAYHKTFRKAFFDQSTEQVPVNFYKNYTGPINHSIDKILALDESPAVAFEKWKTDLMSLNIDRKHLFGTKLGNAKEQDQILKSIFDEIVRGRFGDKGITNTADLTTELIDAPTHTNVEGKLTVTKSIRFLDPESEHKYATKFGDGSLFDTLVGYIDKRSKLLGLMRVLGPEPEKNLAKMAQTLAKSLPDKEARNIFFDNELGPEIKKTFRRVTGASEVPISETKATVTRILMNTQSLALLGKASLASVTNLAYTVGQLRASTGMSFPEALAKSMGEFIQSIPPSGRDEALREMSFALNDFNGFYLSKLNPVERVQRQMLSFLNSSTGLSFLNDATKFSYGRAFYRDLTKQIEKGTVNDRLKSTLLKGGIAPEDYFVLKEAIENFPDGQRHLTPESVLLVKSPEVSVRAKELKKSPEKYLNDLQLGLYAVTNVAANYASTTSMPRAQVSIWGMGGTRAGTKAGMFMRLFGQFKDVQITMFDGMRYMFNAAPDAKELAKGNLIRAKNGDIANVGQVIAFTMTLAYMRYALEDAANGKDIPDPTKPEVLAKALVASGAGGLYADFAFSEFDRYGKWGLLGSVAGPTLGQANDVYNVKMSTYKAIRGYLANDEELTPAQKREFVRFTRRNLPFQNHLFFKNTVDQLVYDEIMESIDPGYSDRRRNRLESLEEQEGRISIFGE